MLCNPSICERSRVQIPECPWLFFSFFCFFLGDSKFLGGVCLYKVYFIYFMKSEDLILLSLGWGFLLCISRYVASVGSSGFFYGLYLFYIVGIYRSMYCTSSGFYTCPSLGFWWGDEGFGNILLDGGVVGSAKYIPTREEELCAVHNVFDIITSCGLGLFCLWLLLLIYYLIQSVFAYDEIAWPHVV